MNDTYSDPGGATPVSSTTYYTGTFVCFSQKYMGGEERVATLTLDAVPLAGQQTDRRSSGHLHDNPTILFAS